ncbi:hypothetical protein BpHYR1_027942 [Brachionus plicatilis]|uniref:Uncharacterized protein n=1 Tax=Brachionus plicatilis TaxID=10195 RepID=A0A3M7P2W0_BRAPC|nr:hypothetical protein BpHYR1_027942 [Brachionus plicatilis]
MVLWGVLTLLIVLLVFFQFAWFITGNVWVYSKHKKVVYDDPNSSFYCDKTLYLFSFWIITSSYIMIGIGKISINK